MDSELSAVIALAVFLSIVSDMSGCSGNPFVAVSTPELTLGDNQQWSAGLRHQFQDRQGIPYVREILVMQQDVRVLELGRHRVFKINCFAAIAISSSTRHELLFENARHIVFMHDEQLFAVYLDLFEAYLPDKEKSPAVRSGGRT